MNIHEDRIAQFKTTSPIDSSVDPLQSDIPRLEHGRSLQLCNDRYGDAMLQSAVVRDVLLESGRVLPEARLSYTVYSTANISDLSKTDIVVLHPALTGTARARISMPEAGAQGDGWWTGCIGSGVNPETGHEYFLNTDQVTVLCFDHFGGRAATGFEAVATSARELALENATVTLRDGVRLTARLLQEEFGISRIRAAVGGSMGGGQALEWLFQDTVAVDKIFDISGCSNLDMIGRTFFEIQAAFLAENKQVSQKIELLADLVATERIQSPAERAVFQRAAAHVVARFQEYENGELCIPDSVEGSKLALVRQFGFLLFVSPGFFTLREGPQGDVCSWLDAQGSKFADRFDAPGLANLCTMIGRSPEMAPEKLLARLHGLESTELIRTGNFGDLLFPAEQQFAYNRELRLSLAAQGRFTEFYTSDARAGHDRFLSPAFAIDDAEFLRLKLHSKV